MLLLLCGSVNLVIIAGKLWTILETLLRNKQIWVFCTLSSWAVLNAISINALSCWKIKLPSVTCFIAIKYGICWDSKISQQHCPGLVKNNSHFCHSDWPALVAEWVKPLAAVRTGQGLLPMWVEACLLPLRVIGLLAGVHAIGLFLDRHRGFTCVLFKMWQVATARFRESCLAAVCAASGILILQAVRLAARWPTCRLLAHGRPMGPTGVNGLAAGGGPAYWAQSGDLAEERQIWYLKLGTILNTTQSSLSLPTHHAYIQTHPPLGLRNGPTYVALALWPNGPPCKWSGVDVVALLYINTLNISSFTR